LALGNNSSCPRRQASASASIRRLYSALNVRRVGPWLHFDRSVLAILLCHHSLSFFALDSTLNLRPKLFHPFWHRGVGQCLHFVIEGYAGENPDELAEFLDATRKYLTKKR
jgi:hypothetical protein